MPKETPGLEFPLDMTVKNAGYTLSDVQSTVRFNIKNIILTNPGERIMIPDFGVGIKQALFENSSIELMQEIQHRINEQMSLYAPYVDILELIITPTDEHSINIKLKYEIDFVEILDSIELDITNI
jgi:phage baseplate assembly protein W